MGQTKKKLELRDGDGFFCVPSRGNQDVGIAFGENVMVLWRPLMRLSIAPVDMLYLLYILTFCIVLS